MADTQTLLNQPKKEIKNPTNPTSVLGGAIGWLDETMELAVRGQGAFVNEGPVRDQDLEQLNQMPELKAGRFPSRGSFENFQESRALKTDADLIAEQRAAVLEVERIMKEPRARTQTEFIQQEEIRFEVTGMSEEERNRRLHLNLSLRKEHTSNLYHEVELYRQKKAELRNLEQQEKNTQIPSPAKQPSALEAIFEGGSGALGGKTANLSVTSGNAGG